MLCYSGPGFYGYVQVNRECQASNLVLRFNTGAIRQHSVEICYCKRTRRSLLPPVMLFCWTNGFSRNKDTRLTVHQRSGYNEIGFTWGVRRASRKVVTATSRGRASVLIRTCVKDSGSVQHRPDIEHRVAGESPGVLPEYQLRGSSS